MLRKFAARFFAIMLAMMMVVSGLAVGVFADGENGAASNDTGSNVSNDTGSNVSNDAGSGSTVEVCTYKIRQTVTYEDGNNREKFADAVFASASEMNELVIDFMGDDNRFYVVNKYGRIIDGVYFYSSNPEVVEMTADVFFTPRSLGTSVVTVDVPEIYGEPACSLKVLVRVTKPSGMIKPAYEYVRRVVSDQKYQLEVMAKSGVTLSYSSTNPSVVTVDQNGLVSLVGPGTAFVEVTSPETERYAADTYRLEFSLIGGTSSDPGTGTGTGTGGSGTGTGTGSSDGTAAGAGQAGTSAGSGASAGTSAGATSTSAAAAALAAQKAQEAKAKAAAAAKAQEAKARAAAAAKAKTLKKPTLKVSRKKRANKLSWNKIANASGYELWIKYPGAKSYVRALTKGATVKSVTHKGLTHKKKYSYKIRAYVSYKNVKFYGPFSKAKTAKVK